MSGKIMIIQFDNEDSSGRLLDKNDIIESISETVQEEFTKLKNHKSKPESSNYQTRSETKNQLRISYPTLATYNIYKP